MNDEAVIEAVYEAALEYIHSVVPAKRIDDLDIAVGIDGGEVTIDIRLATDRGEAVDQKTVDEAIRVASEKSDELMRKT
jgi:formylmethanofuran dehydrogenase subunit E-like metal-binding protein